MRNILSLVTLLISVHANAFDYANQFKNRDEPFPYGWDYPVDDLIHRMGRIDDTDFEPYAPLGWGGYAIEFKTVEGTRWAVVCEQRSGTTQLQRYYKARDIHGRSFLPFAEIKEPTATCIERLKLIEKLSISDTYSLVTTYGQTFSFKCRSKYPEACEPCDDLGAFSDGHRLRRR